LRASASQNDQPELQSEDERPVRIKKTQKKKQERGIQPKNFRKKKGGLFETESRGTNIVTKKLLGRDKTHQRGKKQTIKSGSHEGKFQKRAGNKGDSITTKHKKGR